MVLDFRRGHRAGEIQLYAFGCLLQPCGLIAVFDGSNDAVADTSSLFCQCVRYMHAVQVVLDGVHPSHAYKGQVRIIRPRYGFWVKRHGKV